MKNTNILANWLLSEKYLNEEAGEKKYDSKKSYKNSPKSRIEVIKRLDSVFGDKWRTDKEFDGLRKAFKSSIKNANDTMTDIGLKNDNDADWESMFITTLESTTTTNDYGPNVAGMLNKIGIVG